MLLMCPHLERWELSIQSSNTSLPPSVRQDRQENVRHAHIKTLILSEALASSLDLPSLRQVPLESDQKGETFYPSVWFGLPTAMDHN
jgi:hypothetical protein